ncbi:MAG: hypothetical protein M0R75_13035 [Dehalococcoidia bacterium]|nr:hypothetical protein [Dehalococcoidia bacterium]
MEPAIGDWVLTADGQHLGRVKRVSDGAFQLDVTGEPDYWLRLDEVGGVGEEVLRTVRMSFPSETLEDHRIKYG